MIGRGRSRRASIVLAGLVALAAGLARVADGQARVSARSAFTIDPPRVYLATNARSRTLRLQNLGTSAVRFQLSIFAWGQGARGDTLLTPTEDILVAPMTLTVAPRREGRIRIGMRSPALLGRAERTYRIFIEEQPRAGNSVEAQQPGLHILTRMSIPVFLMPDEPSVSANLDALEVGAGKVAFRLENTGTLHFFTAAIRIHGVDAAGIPVFAHEIPDEYLLPDGVREFLWEIPRPECERVASVTVQIAIPGLPVKEERTSASGACGP